MIPMASWPRFLAVIVCLLGTSAALHLRGAEEAVAPHTDVPQFPQDINGWKGSNVDLTSEDVAILGSGEFLLRDYTHDSGPAVTLFLAYYPSQKSGDTMHSPKNCMPGSGWTPTKSAVISIRTADGRSIHANRYVVTQGKDTMVVLYWYQAHGHTAASEYWAKWLLVRDAITMNRTDGALVRILTSVEGKETETDAERRAIQFALEIAPSLDTYIPR